MKMTSKERGQLKAFLNSMYEIYKVARRDYLLLKTMDEKTDFEVNDIIKMNNALVFLEKITGQEVGGEINEFKTSLLEKTSLSTIASGSRKLITVESLAKKKTAAKRKPSSKKN